jgi:hypothetical protein
MNNQLDKYEFRIREILEKEVRDRYLDGGILYQKMREKNKMVIRRIF